MLIEQLSSYKSRTDDKGRISYTFPRGTKDDFLDALMLGIWGLEYGMKHAFHKNRGAAVRGEQAQQR